MLTYPLIKPSFALLKLGSIFGGIPFQVVQVSTGQLEAKATVSSQFVLRIHRLLAFLKILQLSISFLPLYKSVALSPSPKSVGYAVLVIIGLVAYIVGLAWSFEYEKHVHELIILLSPLRNIGQTSPRPEPTDFEKDQKMTAFFKRKRAQFKGAYRSVLVDAKAFYDDFLKSIQTFSYHDTLAIFLSLVDPLSLGVMYWHVITGDPKETFFLSHLLGAEYDGILALRAGTVLLDLIVLAFISLNFHVSFFALCTILAMNTPELKKLERFIDDKGIKSTQRMRYVWEEIRRLAITFNLFNQVCSNCFYWGKVLAFTWSVFGSFYVLRFGITDVVSCVMAFFAFEAITFYVQCLGSSYVITETMNNILAKIKFRSQFPIPISRRELKQRIKSVRKLALAESEFRGMSKETTPEFVDFYFNQVIALVLTF